MTFPTIMGPPKAFVPRDCSGRKCRRPSWYPFLFKGKRDFTSGVLGMGGLHVL
jgi:hypothetical protein